MPDSLFQRLADDLTPSDGAKDRIRASVKARIGDSRVFSSATQSVDVSSLTQADLWSRIRHQIESPVAVSVFDRLKGVLNSSDSLSARQMLLSRLAPVPAGTPYGRMKWVAAFALVLVVLRASPAVFLAPKTVAESSVLLLPTGGSVEALLHGLWQPVIAETTLQEQVQLRTENGAATILLHDDGTVRLNTETSVILHDLTDRPEPALDGPTLTLTSGDVWLQGFVPRSVRALSVATSFATVMMHDGSAALSVEDGALVVRVFDRSVTVHHGGSSTVLVAGEKARFGDNGSVGQITSMTDTEYENDWVETNLERDAVHRREVAQMQRERSAAQAGILPTSPFYSVKRVVEQVDVLLTIDPAARIQKQIDIASTRLNEAAALIVAGGTGAAAPLQEYKEALLTIASGSGGDSVTRFLLRQEVAENAARLNAAGPSDDFYQLKKVVLEASADLPVGVVDAADVEGAILVDSLDALHEAITVGDTAKATEIYALLQPSLPLLSSGSLAVDVQKEAKAILAQAADKLQQSASGAQAADLAAELEPFLPVPAPVLPSIVHLTDEEIVAFVQQIQYRIDRFTQPRPRLNQLIYEIRQIAGHPDEGRILRSLYAVLPAGQLSREVRGAIQDIRD